MGVFSLACTLCALRTNVALVLVEFFLTLTFAILAGAFFQAAQGGASAASLQIVRYPLLSPIMRISANRSNKAGGACGFVAAMSGWYLFFALMLAGVDFPIALPVGDLSAILKGASEKKSSNAV
jgi:uncharacterized protein